MCYLVSADAAEYVLTPVTAFPAGSDCGLLAKVSGGLVLVLGKGGWGEELKSGIRVWEGEERGLLGENTYTIYKVSSYPIRVPAIQSASRKQGPDYNTLQIFPLRTPVASDFLLVLPDHTEAFRLVRRLSLPDSD